MQRSNLTDIGSQHSSLMDLIVISRLLTFERLVAFDMGGNKVTCSTAQGGGGGKSFQNSKPIAIGLGGLLRCMADRVIR